MRNIRIAGLSAAALVAFAGSAAAEEPGEWVPAPSKPSTVPAGARCTFGVHIEQVVDEVVKRVVETYPDGLVKREEYKGALIDRVTNVDTGASVEANASAHAFLTYQPDGVVTWDWSGPVLMGFGPGQSNHEAGLYLLTGEYTVDISDDYRLVRRADGEERDLCAELS
ncbi:hypothetical protein OU415_18880 [Saccharopolyspora sp. WRP15-2]|uniref:Uncharacterized protein n=1 Tax=Saccharopolyspora oryzae TaxID=2997343 RepID=A0ABT4V0Q0_9PSEU|nr:hypothetical protein [Saccharopolyspora oryzae]MDA3627515.1 hypothetical protein [Saccharopolyspora oryzae]